MASRPVWLRLASLPHRGPHRPDPPVVCPGIEFGRKCRLAAIILPWFHYETFPSCCRNELDFSWFQLLNRRLCSSFVSHVLTLVSTLRKHSGQLYLTPWGNKGQLFPSKTYSPGYFLALPHPALPTSCKLPRPNNLECPGFNIVFCAKNKNVGSQEPRALWCCKCNCYKLFLKRSACSSIALH